MADWAASSSNPYQAASAAIHKSESKVAVIKTEAEREGLRKMGEEAAASMR